MNNKVFSLYVKSYRTYVQHLKQNEHLQHATILIGSSALLIVLLAISLVTRHQALNRLSIPGVVAIVLLSFVPAIVKAFTSTFTAGLYFTLIGAVLVPVAVVEEGGLLNSGFMVANYSTDCHIFLWCIFRLFFRCRGRYGNFCTLDPTCFWDSSTFTLFRH